MEDRCGDRLWFDLRDEVPDDYVRTRLDALLARDGVVQAHLFTNERPDRDDLPRTLEEFTLLGVYEVDEGFVAPDDGSRSLLFERTQRPAQGSLRASRTEGLSVVMISPRRPEDATALRDWADFVHIRHIAETAVPGITMITPYRNAGGDDPMFLHLYEMDSPDAEAVFQSMTPLVTERIGAPDTDAWRHWATCPELRICYVSSFRRLGTWPAVR